MGRFVKKRMVIIAIMALFCFALALALIYMADDKNNSGASIRMEASNYLRALANEDVPGLIENGTSFSMRAWAENNLYNPAFIAAIQMIKDAPALANGCLAGARAPAPVLEPLLQQDGASPPRLYASLPADSGDALDFMGHPLRWRLPANILAGYAPFNGYERRREKSAEEAAPPEPVPSRLPPTVKAGYYRGIVENFSKRYNLNPDLVMAIIHTESDFRPSLVSSKSAMGLMQLLPSTASDEVHRFLHGRRGSVSFEQLRVPETNINYGTAYLHILMSRYFPGVTNPEVREICAVAAYNMGPNRFLRLYGANNQEAADAINAMDAEEFYRDLFSRVPSRETRFFVQKVRRMKQHYTSGAGAAAKTDVE